MECDECEDDECDRFVNRLGPSRETDRRAHDSSVCSGIMPRDTELLHTFVLVAVKSAGVDCDSSWSVLNHSRIVPKQKKKREKERERNVGLFFQPLSSAKHKWI